MRFVKFVMSYKNILHASPLLHKSLSYFNQKHGSILIECNVCLLFSVVNFLRCTGNI